MKRVLSLILAGLLAFAPAAQAADVKPLVNASGAIRPVHAGETVGVANGGTGAATLTSHCVLIGLGTSAVHFACPSSSGQVLTDNGASSDPTFQAAAGGSGTVTTTGSPASGNLTKFSGATSITNGDLSGDISTSGTLVTTLGALKVATGMIQASAVTLAKLANIADQTILGNNTGGSAAPVALTAAQVRTVLALAASATTDTTNASNISSGTLAAARLPLGSTATVGAVKDDGGVTTSIAGDGTVTALAGGTIQNTGSFDAQWFGDGSDGNVTCSAGSSLARDMYYGNLTLSAGCAIQTIGWKIHVSGTLDATSAPAGAISYNGSNGNNAIQQNGGTGVTGKVSRTVGGSPTSGTGATGTTAGGAVAGTVAAVTVIGGLSGEGGAGGTSGANTGGASRAAVTPTNPADIRRLQSDLSQWTGGVPTWTIILGGESGPGGSAGAGDGTGLGGGGGAGGTGAGVVWLAAKTISRGGSTAAGAIQAKGGAGGTGAVPPSGGANRGGGGGGAGAGGGWIYLIVRSLTGSTATNMLDATGGNGGAGATGSGTANGGDSGGAGGGGRIDIYNLGVGTVSIPGTTAPTAGNAHSGATGGATKTATAQQSSL